MKELIIAYNSLAGGGITSSLIDVLNTVDFSEFNVTVYIRRDDYLYFKDYIPAYANLIIVHNSVRSREFGNSLIDKAVKSLYNFLKKKHKYYAKKLLLFYGQPKQRIKEASFFKNKKYDIAICYSTDSDDPIFCEQFINADFKYIFVHQSTDLSKKSIRAISQFDACVLVNPMLYDWASSFIKTKLITIPNYVDYNKVRSLAEHDINYSKKDNCKILLTCGRLVKNKGLDLLIDTCINLVNVGFNFKWLWVGDGEDIEYFKEKITNNYLTDFVEIIGNKINPYPYFKICDYYVHPSLFEAYGLVLFEALSLSKICISTRTVGAEYVFSNFDCGFLTDFSGKDIASKILELENNLQLIENEFKKISSIDFEVYQTKYKTNWSYLLNNRIELLADDN